MKDDGFEKLKCEQNDKNEEDKKCGKKLFLNVCKRSCSFNLNVKFENI